MSKPSRRSLLASASAALALAPASCAPAFAALTLPDPVAVLVGEYDRGLAIYLAAAAAGDCPDDFSDETYGPALMRLLDDPPEPTTMAGAIAGIDWARRMHLDEDMAIAPLLGKCLAYLRSMPQ